MPRLHFGLAVNSRLRVLLLLRSDFGKAGHQSVLRPLLLLWFISQLGNDLSLNSWLGEDFHLTWHQGLFRLLFNSLRIDNFVWLPSDGIQLTKANSLCDVFWNIRTQEICVFLQLEKGAEFGKTFRIVEMDYISFRRIKYPLEFESKQSSVELRLVIERNHVFTFASDPPQDYLNISSRVFYDFKCFFESDALDTW